MGLARARQTPDLAPAVGPAGPAPSHDAPPLLARHAARQAAAPVDHVAAARPRFAQHVVFQAAVAAALPAAPPAAQLAAAAPAASCAVATAPLPLPPVLPVAAAPPPPASLAPGSPSFAVATGCAPVETGVPCQPTSGAGPPPGMHGRQAGWKHQLHHPRPQERHHHHRPNHSPEVEKWHSQGRMGQSRSLGVAGGLARTLGQGQGRGLGLGWG